MSQPTLWVSTPLFGADRTPRLTGREHDQYLLALREIPREQYRLEAREFRLIEGARNLGVTWKRIAEALRLESPQAAHRRYGKLRDLLEDAQRREQMAPCVREIPIKRRQGKTLKTYIVLIDDEDYELVSQYNWHIRINKRNTWGPYALGAPKGAGNAAKEVFMHALIMGGIGIDHINHNGLDNRRSNLRFATPSENMRNRGKPPGTMFRYKGVRYHGRKWIAKIQVDRKLINLGGFASEEEAARAWDAAARKYHGEFACLNFPEECGEQRQFGA